MKNSFSFLLTRLSQRSTKASVRVVRFLVPIVAVALGCLLLVRGLKGQISPPPGTGPTPIQLAGWKAVEDRPLNDSETLQLNSLLATASAAANSLTPGPDAGAQRRAIDLELCAELETFVTNNPASTSTT